MNTFFLLKTIGKTILATIFSATVLFLFYWFTKDGLYQHCISISSDILSNLGYQKLAPLFGGSAYLGICVLIFSPVYYFFANLFGVIDEDEQEIINRMILRIKGFFIRSEVHTS